MNTREIGNGPVVIEVVEAGAAGRQVAPMVAAPLWLKELLVQGRQIHHRAGSLGLSRPVCEHFAAPPDQQDTYCM
ncbi:Uncharacterised protein [Mycobacteroides abscessus subsp. abscessus]|uniref:hypothetical protein n=1 Tax=Mycobacteroides abscessus TaxID=36809 RepID=UPI00092ADC04|nr:hypothetical protein [Mycobacteroides abscessus]SIC51981.1 Uncharacterised protein [Mycobacteroides abscessus subsp. abscessus]SID07559.1 Uncharacterised protein [Mycobacteroides abscessus subsp. abscessus]SID34485.1 Uncharacterised protein [Mycobacteroides abscessus subsp. abscessus]SID41119.1 Uncharacterised protein [Mycobacteroides abscessus subsp. abscessus]SKT65871.1 Uncharacterised protein [Mycobacteroides abscessus subsp. abscessus]